MAAKPTQEGRRLTQALFWLETETLVVKTPSALPAPDMSTMLGNLHQRYREVVNTPCTAQFSDIHQAALHRLEDAPEPTKVRRVAHYGGQLHDIVSRAHGTVSEHGVDVDERKLTPEDATTITRAWEVSLDELHLVTYVHLGHGDVLTQFAYPGESAASDDIVAFHGEMATLSLTGWEELIDLVSRFLATLVGLVLKAISTRTWPQASHKPRRVRLRPGGREIVLTRAHEMFGTGGKLFLTDAPDGTAGGIRTLVQLDGHIVTRVTKDSMLDSVRLGQHRAAIEAWFAKLNRDWRRISMLLTAGATALTGAATVGDVTTFRRRRAGT